MTGLLEPIRRRKLCYLLQLHYLRRQRLNKLLYHGRHHDVKSNSPDTQVPPAGPIPAVPTTIIENDATPTRWKGLIRADTRIEFDINFDKLTGRYRLRPRTKRNVDGALISWIFKHGKELEKDEGSQCSQWVGWGG